MARSNLVLRAFLILLLAGCSQHRTHTVDEISAAWIDLCESNGPTKENAELIANTYSLNAFSKSDVDEKKALYDDQNLLSNQSASNLNLRVTSYVSDLSGWWFDSSLKGMLRFDSVVQTVAIGTPQQRTNRIASCAISGNTKNYSAIEQTMRALDKIGLTNLKVWKSQTLVANQTQDDGTKVMITGREKGNSVQIILQDLDYYQKYTAALRSHDLKFFETDKHIFTPVEGPFDNYFRGQIHYSFDVLQVQ